MRLISSGVSVNSFSRLERFDWMTGYFSPGCAISSGVDWRPPEIRTIATPVMPYILIEAMESSLIGVSPLTSSVTRTRSTFSGSMRISVTVPIGTPR